MSRSTCQGSARPLMSGSALTRCLEVPQPMNLHLMVRSRMPNMPPKWLKTTTSFGRHSIRVISHQSLTVTTLLWPTLNWHHSTQHLASLPSMLQRLRPLSHLAMTKAILPLNIPTLSLLESLCAMLSNNHKSISLMQRLILHTWCLISPRVLKRVVIALKLWSLHFKQENRCQLLTVTRSMRRDNTQYTMMVVRTYLVCMSLNHHMV
mmetsp:Transcript_14834/g.22233  ORF Transcript_14834/g.22233 Transcript_14834/m.22233 type:complete len:207 (+) Transcript_14834:621-1241(+)